jgi:glutamate N-acetyltransferase/amino-acid N-acetyltransferase
VKTLAADCETQEIKAEVEATPSASANLCAASSGGGITSPKGFKATGAFIGIKKLEKADLALVWSEVPAKCAAVFTTNVVKAAPVLWNQKVLQKSQSLQGIVINSGNANACTGTQGMLDAEAMASVYAESMGVSADEILVASTGVIGVPLPIALITKGIKQTASALVCSEQGGLAAAEAIMTTDTYAKHIAHTFEADGKTVTIGAMAKGSGMIHPNMATMLSFVTTDLNITTALLEKALKASTAQTYNMISVDGDTSTNDMVAILANGKAGNKLIEQEDADYLTFCQALNEVNTAIAKSIIQDGEGATKFLEVQVKNADTVENARIMARAVVSSNLVKAAFFGEDANWGRIICAMGYSGAQFAPEDVSIVITSEGGKLELMKEGEPSLVNEDLAKKVLAAKEIVVSIDMKNGHSQGTAWGCDLSYEYVRINGAYRT